MTTWYKLTSLDGKTFGGFHWPLPSADGPGAWVEIGKRARKPLTTADLCTKRVLHVTDADHLLDHAKDALWEVEIDESRGLVIGADKAGCRRARLVRRIESWNERTLRHFAADMAESVLHLAREQDRPILAATIAVARRHADGLATDAELSAAESAAESAS